MGLEAPAGRALCYLEGMNSFLDFPVIGLTDARVLRMVTWAKVRLSRAIDGVETGSLAFV